jgi:hypothetical protein
MHPQRLLHLYALSVLLACSGADGSSLFDGNDAATTLPDASSPDVGTEPPPDAGISVDALPPKDVYVKDVGNPYVDPGIACGTTDCAPDADICCGTITSYYPTYTYSYACQALNPYVQCAGGLPLYCDDDHDCPTGQVCCGDLGYQNYAKVSCKPSCTGSLYGYQQIHFCDPKAPDCDSTQACTASTVLTGYYVCQ